MTTSNLRKNYVGGQWVGASGERTFERRNPADLDEIVSLAPDSDSTDVCQAVEHVANNYHEWARLAPDVRADVLSRAAADLESRAGTLVDELVREEGKTRAEAWIEVRRTPQNLRYYASEALRLNGETVPTGDGSLVLTLRQPVGVVAAITPWNFPLNIPSRKLGPALAAGNGVVFKPSEVTPLMGQRLVESLEEAGVPGGALALVHGRAEVGKALVTDSRVNAVTFTGSTQVGEAIHGNLPPWVRCQLEMGGKNAVVVCDDADLDLAARIVVRGAFGLSGQACTGTSRVVVYSSVLPGLLDRVMEAARAVVIGNGLDEGVTMGPLATEAQLAKYKEYLAIGREEGAVLETPTYGRDRNGGHFARPAVFTNVAQESRLAQEEVFGPVLGFIEVGGYDEAVEVVNNSVYGLSAGIVTTNLSTALAFTRDADAGLVKVNQPTSGMAMNAPFGGMKHSSTQTSKEQAGASMMQFYTNDKTAYITP
jgi:alpha-ketoglutaric semialdehyde dehydrogenase